MADYRLNYTGQEVADILDMGHSHTNKAVLDNISSTDISNWNGKSDFSGSYNDLTNKPTIPVVPTNVSSFTNDAGYLTSFTETDPIFTASAAHNITSTDISNWNGKSDFSGSYNDLTNKPTIPVVPTNVSSFTNDAGYLTSFTETDPIFTASAAHSITSSDITNWNNKVDSVSGKGLSTNDYTTAEKTKLSGIESGAQVNVQSDWNQTNSSASDYIKNKPTGLATETYVNNQTLGNSTNTYKVYFQIGSGGSFSVNATAFSDFMSHFLLGQSALPLLTLYQGGQEVAWWIPSNFQMVSATDIQFNFPSYNSNFPGHFSLNGSVLGGTPTLTLNNN